MALGALEIALNQYLRGDPRALARCRQLQGRTLAIDVRDLALEIHLRAHDDALEVTDRLDGTADVRLSAPAAVFARTLFAGGGASVAGRGLRIEGDVGLAQDFANMLSDVDIDIEDWLEPRVGGLPAHWIGRGIKQSRAFAERALRSLSADTAEFLREETRDLVHADDVNEFIGEVDRLRADADRLAARVRRLAPQGGVKARPRGGNNHA